jgi:hypothetical protein
MIVPLALAAAVVALPSPAASGDRASLTAKWFWFAAGVDGAFVLKVAAA